MQNNKNITYELTSIFRIYFPTTMFTIMKGNYLNTG